MRPMTQFHALAALVALPFLASPALGQQQAAPHTPSVTAQALLNEGKPVVGTDGQEVGRIVEVKRAEDGSPTAVVLESARESGAISEGDLVEVPLDLLFTDGAVIGLDLNPGETERGGPNIPPGRGGPSPSE